MINWFQLGTMAVATPLTVFWMVLYFKYQNMFQSYIENLSPKEYKLPELFFIGMGFMHLTHYDLHTRKGRMRIKEISEIKGKKYAEYYYYIIKAATFSYILTFVPLAMYFGVLADNPKILLIGISLAVLLVRYLEKDINDKLEERREESVSDWGEGFVSGNAGNIPSDGKRSLGFGGISGICRSMFFESGAESYFYIGSEHAKGKPGAFVFSG